MITILKKSDTNIKDNEREIEMRGLSTDNKPIEAANGTVFIEIDTGKLYMFDAENSQWKEI